MKFCAIVAVLLVSLFATSMAVPAYKRMAYYQQPSVYFQARSAPQRLTVLQQYVQQPKTRTHARSAAYVAEENAASVEQQAAEESVISDAGVNEAEPYPAAGGQVSAEFEGTFADGGTAGVSGIADIPAAEIPASGEIPQVPEAPEVPELPEAPVVDNQVLEDDSAPSAAVPEVAPSSQEVPSDDEAKAPRELDLDNTAGAVPEPAVASAEVPYDAPVEAPVAEEAAPEVPAIPEIPEVPELPEVPAVPSIVPEQAPAEEAPVPAVASVPVAAAAPSVPAVAPVATPVAVAPPKRYLPPRKKVSVKLDQSAAANDDDDAADNYRPARIPNARRPVKGSGSAVAAKGTKAPLPVGTYFPINFGGTTGGAIAIANSFSTGEGGSATSHAIAYGSPDAARSKARPIRRRH